MKNSHVNHTTVNSMFELLIVKIFVGFSDRIVNNKLAFLWELLHNSN